MYHQYVLIDTSENNNGKGINNYENGLLYQRGFNSEEPRVLYIAPIFDGGTTPTNEEAIINRLKAPGAGAIYKGCIRGGDGPGLLID